MLINYLVVLIAMFIVHAGEKPENPWIDQLIPAVENARKARTVSTYRTALEAAWRADDWQVGLELAREALQKWPAASKLHGPVARAFWRAGYIIDAERAVARISGQREDRVALQMLITVHLASGRHAPARQAAELLETLKPATAEDLFYIIGLRAAFNQLDGLGKLIRRAEKLVDPSHGYPEIYIQEQLEGLAEFFDAIGNEPVNQLANYGSCPMPVISLINLPGCQVYINGHGPYRMIVDTGGSTILSLDEKIAAEIGLKSIATSTIHGVAGKEESGQVLVDQLQIGEIICRRVMTRTFALSKSIAYAADGVIGTGIFANGRMTFDFNSGRLTVAPSALQSAPGDEVDLRIISDAKFVIPITLHGEPAAALLDSGADAFAVAPSRLRRLFPDEKIRTIQALALGVGGDENPSISLTPGVNFEFAGREYKNFGGLGLDALDTLLGPLLGLQTDVLVGMPILRQMKTMTVDFPRCKMWAEWLEAE